MQTANSRPQRALFGPLNGPFGPSLRPVWFWLIGAWLVLCPSCTRPAPPMTASATSDAAAFVAADAPLPALDAVDADIAPTTDSAPAQADGAGADVPSSDAPSTSWSADGGCTPGEQLCLNAELATCSSAGDGWTLSPCYPGQYCDVDSCVPLEQNLIIAFDTSGSMNTPVPGVACAQPGFPSCAPGKGCTRMDVSKSVFLKALAKVDTKVTRLALFRFPQRITRTLKATCARGYYGGFPGVSGDLSNDQSVTAGSAWFWDSLHEIRCVDYPSTQKQAELGHLQIGQWMDGKESLSSKSGGCAGGAASCAPNQTCGAGACCAGVCVHHKEPELRSHGGTPIGKTLFYIGEYIRHRVVVDGLPCTSDSGCGSPNYHCVKGLCADAARACRETVVVLFTDGGQANDPTNFFSPRVAAQRLAYGLACKTKHDCAGGAACTAGRCLPASPTGYHCMATGTPCWPGTSDPKDKTFCPSLPGQGSKCLPDLLSMTKAKADNPLHNVLRSPDGRPFGVRVHVVDISDAADLALSHHLAQAGRGRLFTASSTDPLAFVQALESAFDMKNKTVCGTTQ